ncbi:MAG: hypothetical protein ACJ76H_03760 [Bacteriovoracaceae bacterium]
MKIASLFLIYASLILVNFSDVSAQSLVEDANINVAQAADGSFFTETIKIISNSKKIFILTNNNQQLGPGDFISLALDSKLAARALVAKTHQGQVGIKILKIYSLNQWGKLRRDQDVQIVKGDDSNFMKRPEDNLNTENGPRIKEEDDLYSKNVVVDDELEFTEDNKNRHIKPDNVVGIFAGINNASNPQGGSGGYTRGTEFGLTWAYQFTDNFFIEGVYGRTLFDNYPADSTQTLANRFVGRVKYNIKGPLYTFFMPYVGYQNTQVASPDAGKAQNQTPAQNQAEVDAVNKLKKTGVVAGVTILRRLVPGWFLKADVGTDMIDAGFCIEF